MHLCLTTRDGRERVGGKMGSAASRSTPIACAARADVSVDTRATVLLGGHLVLVGSSRSCDSAEIELVTTTE